MCRHRELVQGIPPFYNLQNICVHVDVYINNVYFTQEQYTVYKQHVSKVESMNAGPYIQVCNRHLED